MVSKWYQNDGKIVPRRSHNGPEGSGTAGATTVYVAIFGAYAIKTVCEKTLLLLDVSEKNPTNKMTATTMGTIHVFVEISLYDDNCKQNLHFWV